MISNPEQTVLVSSMGWVDADALWRFDVPSGRIDRLPLGSGARYVSVHASGGSRFAVVHHFDGARFMLTVRAFADPMTVLARAGVDAARRELVGDASAWDGVPRLYVELLNLEPWNDYVLVQLAPLAGRIDVQRLEWYDDTYDKMYQSVIGVLGLPGERTALVAVQRSSTLVLHDLETGGKTGTVGLAGRGGNPEPRFRDGGDEIWAVDYDTLVVLAKSPPRRVRKARLQGAMTGTQQFVGDYSFAPDQPVCVVARPFSGDVVGLDAATLRIKSRAKVGRQPLAVAALPGGEVVARDWKTGDLLRGRLERRGWFAA